MVIRVFAEAAGSAMRRNDCFGRIGGDEFAIVLPLETENDARKTAAMLHVRLSSILRDTALPVTCSMGAIIAPAVKSHELTDLTKQADKLMYEVKAAGKNAVAIAIVDDQSVEDVARVLPSRPNFAESRSSMRVGVSRRDKN